MATNTGNPIAEQHIILEDDMWYCYYKLYTYLTIKGNVTWPNIISQQREDALEGVIMTCVISYYKWREKGKRRDGVLTGKHYQSKQLRGCANMCSKKFVNQILINHSKGILGICNDCEQNCVIQFKLRFDKSLCWKSNHTNTITWK